MNYFELIETKFEKSGSAISEFDYWGLATDSAFNKVLTIERLSHELNGTKQRPFSPAQCSLFLRKCVGWKKEILKAKLTFDPDTTNLEDFFNFIDGVEIYVRLLSEKKITKILLFRYCIELALLFQHKSMRASDEETASLSFNTPLIPRTSITRAWGNLQQFLSRYYKQLQRGNSKLFFKRYFPKQLFELFNDAKDLSFPVLFVDEDKKGTPIRGTVKNCVIWTSLKLNPHGEEGDPMRLIALNKYPESMLSELRIVKDTITRSIGEAFVFSGKILGKRLKKQSLQAIFFQIGELNKNRLDGSSIGCAALMAAISRITGRHLPPYVCFTGKFGCANNGIKGVTERAKAGWKHGFKILVLPNENLNELTAGLRPVDVEYDVLKPGKLGDFEGQLTICPYGSMDDLFKIWRTLTHTQAENRRASDRFKSGSNLTNQYPNTDFVERKDYLTWLNDKFETGVSIATLSGPGGIGKTQIAQQYASRYRKRYSLVWIIRGEDRPTIDESYAQLANELNLPQKDFNAEKVIRSSVKRWLENNPGWLLIFDNVSSPGLLLDTVVGFLPRGGGNTIITSRYDHWGKWSEQIEVKPVNLAESVQYLLKMSGVKDISGAEELSQKLGNLPLALTLAAAYIRKNSITFLDYIKKYDTERKKLLLKEEVRPDYPYTIAITRKMAIEQIRKNHPLALDILNIAAFQSSDNIPMQLLFPEQTSNTALEMRRTADRSVFARSTKKRFHRIGDPAKKGKPVGNEPNWASLNLNENNIIKFKKALRSLKSYALVSGSFQSISVNNLVQQVTRDSLTQDEEKEWCGLTLNLMNHSFPLSLRRLEDKTKCEKLYPHAVSVTLNAKRLNVLPHRNLSLIRRLAQYLADSTSFDKAEEVLDLALEIAYQIYNETDFQVAWILRLRGHCLKEQEFLDAAIKTYQRVLKITIDAREAKESEIATDLNNLGEVALISGKTNEAHKLFEESLLRIENARSSRGNVFAMSYNFLGRTYATKGQFLRAEEAFENAFEIAKIQFGKRHPFIAEIRRNRGEMLLQSGKLYRAYEELDTALQIDQAFYGPRYPIVALDKNLIGELFLEEQILEKAEKNLTEALQINERIYGALDFHPTIARDQNSLGKLEMEKGNFNEAKIKFQKALLIAGTIYYQNPDHVSIADVEINYGTVLLEEREFEDGRRRILIAKRTYEKVYGKKHPILAKVMISLGRTYQMDGMLNDAMSYYDRAKEILENNCDEKHPSLRVVNQYIQEF
ncbi:MAG: tetratricopeptide repeat protein [Deltaproteobacteria bacterium]|nr:tetratricopeptide repeat protein [Deltaproteobacteria bacterium]